jgi:integrase
MKISKTSVSNLPFAESGQVIYWDTELAGFGVRVGSKTKTYIAQKRVEGRTVRAKIGASSHVTAEQARKMAVEKLFQMTQGKDVNQIKKDKKSDHVTLEIAFNDYLETRSLKERTIKDYKRSMKVAFKDWRKKKITDISREMVSKRHKKLGETMGEAQANQHLRFLRSLLNFSAGQYEDTEGKPLIKENPVLRLSQTQAWYIVKRRQTMIKPHQLPNWYDAVKQVKSKTIRDYIMLIFLTGLRRQEGFCLRWEDVDLEAKTFVVQDPKNSNPLALPMGTYVYKMLGRRKNEAGESEYVFPSRIKFGHLTEPKKQVQWVAEKSGVQFCLHDLRRGFITCAEGLNVSSYAVKQLVNHSTGTDVTGGYIIPNPDRLRKPMQKIENHLLKLCRVKEAGKIIPIKPDEKAG